MARQNVAGPPAVVVAMSRNKRPHTLLPSEFQISPYRAGRPGGGHHPCCTKLGERLREQRIARGWTQKQMADRLSNHAARVSMWEQGKHLPDLLTVHRYASAFDMTVSQLLDGVL
jgi:DNA-binding XRE family transcriptional regulator